MRMNIEDSLRKNFIRTVVGGIVNMSQGGVKRRYTLFFEDILAEYVREVESSGHGADVQEADQKWMNLVLKKHATGLLRKLPPTIFINDVLGSLWVRLGLMDEVHLTREDGTVTIKTKNEGVTRIIGPNRGMIGFHMGVCNVAFECGVRCISSRQSRESCEYVYELEDTPFDVETRPIAEYDRLNYLPEQNKIKGVNLAEALNNRLIVLRENKLYFRERFLCPVENTIFHILGNKSIHMDAIPGISTDYFRQCIDEDTSAEKKLSFLKTLLQLMGWGVVRIAYEADNIDVEISNPPHGLQREGDNWDVILNVVLGYLRMVNEDLMLSDKRYNAKMILARYSVRQ